MLQLVFATNNSHKVNEIQALINEKIKILTLNDINCHEDIPETSPTIEGNALQKARYLKEKYNYDCFADDTGLIVEALNGEPGVYSARYAGPHRNDDDNMNLLLEKLSDKENRNAKFQTVIALILNGEEHIFVGEVHGTIATEKKGSEGFGYDPIFIPDGYDCSFAEMSAVEKNKISHRGNATRKLLKFLKSIN
jgi:XTP/dITP diphosphohydrolase